MKKLRSMMAKVLPVGGSTSLQTSDTTNQTAAIKSQAEAYGQRGVFITTGTGGSKVTPSFEGSNSGGNTVLIIAGLAVALVMFVLFRRKKK
jgi:LPXTG-motif cell wall-anchored protein